MRPVKVEVYSVNEEIRACRICLITNTKLYNIHDYGLDTAFSELMGTSVSRTDGFPQDVCSFCGRLLEKACELRQRWLRSHRLLQQVILHRHEITPSFIHNIDRIANQLTLQLSTQTNTTIIECEHDEIKTEIDVKLDDEIKFEDFNNVINDDFNTEIEIEEEIKEITPKDRGRRKKNYLNTEIEIEEEIKEITPKDRGRRKKNDLNTEIEIEEEITPKDRGTKKKKDSVKRKKPKKIRKMFDCEEDFPKFESKYNVEIVVLTAEQQIESMASRKNSSNYMSSPFKCELCFKGFSSDSTFQNHNKKHHDPSVGKQQCELCQCRFRIPAFLRTHLETHRLKFVCRECRFIASNRYHAITHSREHSGFKYICKYCGASFKKPSTHGTHVRVQHPTENTSCDVCGETFQGEAGLRMHKTKAHKQIEESEVESNSCASCGVQFASSYAKKRHTDTSPNNECNPAMRACTLCGENLSSEELLEEHSRLRHSKPHTSCDQCNKSFLSEASLSVHYDRVHLQVKSVRRKAAHHATKQYGVLVMCELCGKRCKNSTILKYHQRTHTGEKPHSCPRCPKRFVSPMLLHCHLRSHTGERPYKCAQCHKSFTQKSALTVHKTVHTGEKPYSCSICGKTFTQSASVHTHVKYVHMKMPAPPRRRNIKD